MTVHKILTTLFVSLAFLLAGCEAEEASVPETNTAQYPTDPETGERLCAGIAGFACGEGEYCQFAEGTCQIVDNMGICKRKPEICTMDFRPVCGCDGKTYGNACAAAGAGVSLARQGPCEEA